MNQNNWRTQGKYHISDIHHSFILFCLQCVHVTHTKPWGSKGAAENHKAPQVIVQSRLVYGWPNCICHVYGEAG